MRVVTNANEPAWVAQLRQSKGDLPPALRTKILAGGKRAVRYLIQLVDEVGGDESWQCRVRAIELLVELGAPPEAVPALVRLLARLATPTSTRDTLVRHLPAFGPSLIEPTLAVLAIGHDRDRYLLATTCRVLSRVGVRDERIYGYLCALYDVEQVSAAECFGNYGDARALLRLEKIIADFPVDPDHPCQLVELYLAVDAHAKCGGSLPESLRARVHGLTNAWKDAVMARAKRAGKPVRGVQKTGDACRCGSGAVYEACCRGKLRESKGGPNWTDIADNLPWEWTPRRSVRAVH